MVGVSSIVRFFSEIQIFLEQKTKPFTHLSLSKAGPFTLESHICFESIQMQGFPKHKMHYQTLIEKEKRKSTQTHFQEGTPWVTQILNSVIVWMMLYCAQKLLRWNKIQNHLPTFLWVKLVHLLWKAIFVLKASKCKASQNIRCLIKPLKKGKKKNTLTHFQEGTPWVTQILNNVIVWMVLYCAQKLLGWKNIQKHLLTILLGKLVHWLFHDMSNACYAISMGLLWDLQ